ncbi:MAG: YegS/Rv2252/BmrU family lipid kinase [Erysipelotrichaceae bacterium]|nr:YegS/Rv2252/BmrU family lipid kinase [Erysipelotrichaceae bacterium]
MKKLLLIINDITGNGRNSINTFKMIREFARAGYETTVFPIVESIELKLSDYFENSLYDKVVCIGGDGTLNRTINEVMKLDNKPLIGYIPAGTTNDFSKNLNLTNNIDRAIEIINRENSISLDLGKFNDRYFNYVASFGAFSDISYTTDQNFKNVFGYAAYFLSGITSIQENLSLRCHMKITTDTESFEGDYFFGAICNSKSVAGVKLEGITLDSLHDGQFELFLIKCPENVQELGEIALAVLNSNYESPYIEYRKVKKAHIVPSENTEWTLDGEYGGNPESIAFEIIPKAVQLLI